MNGDTLSLFKFDIKMTGTLANGAKKWSRLVCVTIQSS